MENILTKIVQDKAEEVEAARYHVPLAEVKAQATDCAPVRSLRRSLESRPEGGVIAEFKRRSPSKDWIKRDARVADIIPQYEKAGAAGLSILTDSKYFGGTLDDVRVARPLTELPILRKEFVIDAYQLYKARAAGADACLLIAAAIGNSRCHELAEEAKEIGLEVILEIHCEEELEAYTPFVDILGVNNRDLRVFRTSPVQSERLFPLLPDGPLPISESGLLDPLTAKHLREVGYRGFLVGEAFMRTPDPGTALRTYLNTLRK